MAGPTHQRSPRAAYLKLGERREALDSLDAVVREVELRELRQMCEVLDLADGILMQHQGAELGLRLQP